MALEHKPEIDGLRAIAVAAVVAPSFSGLYFRNAFNVGLLLLPIEQARRHRLTQTGQPCVSCILAFYNLTLHETHCTARIL